MKRLIITMLVAMTTTVGTLPAQADLSPDGAVAVEHLIKLEACFQEMTDVLSQITDKASADAMAPAFVKAAHSLTAQIVANETLQHKLTGTPTADDDAAFAACSEKLHTAGMSLQAELRRLAMVQFYESEALIQAIMALQAAE